MNINQKILSLKGLPTLGGDVRFFLESIQDPDVEFSEVVSHIEKNITLSAHLLKVANSVKYAGKYASIGGISQAVSRIGLKEVSKISLALAVIQASPDSKAINIKEFWKHSVSVALITRLIIEGARETKMDKDMAYIAGLFHDIGILILSQLEPESYLKLIEKSESQNLDISYLEREFFGLSHGDAGYILLEHWNLPAPILSAVKNHHFPDMSEIENTHLTQAVHVANFYASTFGFLIPSKKMPEACSQGALHDLSLSSETLQAMVENVRAEINSANFFV